MGASTPDCVSRSGAERNDNLAAPRSPSPRCDQAIAAPNDIEGFEANAEMAHQKIARTGHGRMTSLMSFISSCGVADNDLDSARWEINSSETGWARRCPYDIRFPGERTVR